MTGRLAVLKAYGGDFELREYPVPDPEPGADWMPRGGEGPRLWRAALSTE